MMNEHEDKDHSAELAAVDTACPIVPASPASHVSNWLASATDARERARHRGIGYDGYNAMFDEGFASGLETAANALRRNNVEGAEPRLNRYTPARLDFCRLLFARCRDMARDEGCTNAAFSPDDTCIGSEFESRDWCAGCLLGEASVQLEWLLTLVGTSSTQSSSQTVDEARQELAQQIQRILLDNFTANADSEIEALIAAVREEACGEQEAKYYRNFVTLTQRAEAAEAERDQRKRSETDLIVALDHANKLAERWCLACKAAEAERDHVCVWTRDPLEAAIVYARACDGKLYQADTSPAEDGLIYCAHCGGRIAVVKESK